MYSARTYLICEMYEHNYIIKFILKNKFYNKVVFISYVHHKLMNISYMQTLYEYNLYNKVVFISYVWKLKKHGKII
jgi:hypothetical protein